MKADNDNAVPTKVCTACGEEKPTDSFYVDRRRGGFRPECKQCSSVSGKATRDKNPAAHKEYNDAWYRRNSRRKNDLARKWQIENPDKVLAHQKKWREVNSESIKERRRETDKRKRSAPKGKLENNIKAGIHRGLTKGSKSGRKTFAILGYTLDELAGHLESLFQPGMTWDNYGEWHVDHKVPLAAQPSLPLAVNDNTPRKETA